MKGVWLLMIALLGSTLAIAGETGSVVDRQPAVAIIIDDLGYRYRDSIRAIRLPGPLTYAFLPKTPHAQQLAELAHRGNKEVMLHLPMESIRPQSLGPGGLTLHMTEAAFKSRLVENFEAIPHVAGVNIHMGSLLSQHPGHMAWLMESIVSRNGLYFVDSRTTAKTVALQLAQEHLVPSLKRDVFLDTVPDEPEYVHAKVTRLVALARKQGTALAIGHPYQATLDVLQQTLVDTLAREGVNLVKVSELIALKQRRKSWRVSSSHSPTVVKN